jgi:glyoxylase-like metal-dependent hydrolase (beta-lactamase superfamily II)
LRLPPTIRVMERGWLSSNNILLTGSEETVLVDSGYLAHAPQTLALVEHALFDQHLGGRTLDRLVNTHCHSDHMGGNAALQRRYRCHTSVPIGEAPLIERWDEDALLLAYADQRAERFRVDASVAAGDRLSMGGIDWVAIAAPGHDTHALMFHSSRERILISGDALWEDGFGVLFPQLFGREGTFAETRRTLDSIAALDVRLVIPGHGEPFEDVDAALERAYSRLHAFEEDPARLARHAARVMLTFALLEKQRLPIASLPDYVERTGILRDINRRFLALTPQHFAEWLVHELERARAVKREGDNLVPLITP